jgi:hypothetical protein
LTPLSNNNNNNNNKNITLLLLHPHAQIVLTPSRKTIHSDGQTSNMTLKTECLTDEEMSILEMLGKLGKLNTTASNPEDSTPSDTSHITKSGQNNFFDIRRLWSKLTQPSLSTVDLLLSMFVVMLLTLFTQDVCNRCKKQGQAKSLSSTSCPVPSLIEAPGQGTAWAIPQPGMYAMVNHRLTKIGDITYGQQ